VTIAKRPSVGQDGLDMHLIWVSGEAKYFCKRGWISHFGKHEVICPSGKISRPVYVMLFVFLPMIGGFIASEFSDHQVCAAFSAYTRVITDVAIFPVRGRRRKCADARR